MSLFRTEVIDAQRRRLHGDVILANQPSLLAWTAVACLASLSIILIVAFGQYVKKETVQGYLVPESGIIRITSTHGGRVTSVRVAEDDHVISGTPLLAFSNDQSGLHSEGQLSEQLSQLALQLGRSADRSSAALQSLSGERLRLQQQLEGNERTERILKDRLAEQNQLAAISQSQMDRYKTLIDKGYVSQIQVDQLRQQILSQQLAAKELEQAIVSSDTTEGDLKSQLSSIIPKIKDSVAEGNIENSEIEQKRIELSTQKNYLELAPVSGRIASVDVQAGQTPDPGATLITIMPDNSPIIAELLLPTRAAGFVQPGIDVKLQVDAFPFQQFGYFPGKVISISKSAILPGTYPAPVSVLEAAYKVRVALRGDTILAYGQKRPLISGMTLKADIIVEKKPLWMHIFEPIVSASRISH